MTITVQPASLFVGPQGADRIKDIPTNDPSGSEASDAMFTVGQDASPVGSNIPQAAPIRIQVWDIGSLHLFHPCGGHEIIGRQEHDPIGRTKRKRRVVLGSKWIVRDFHEADPEIITDRGENLVPCGDRSEDRQTEGRDGPDPLPRQIMPGVHNGDYR